MTDFPSPSDRSKSVQSARPALVLALFRPFLFAIAAIGLTLGALIVLHRPELQTAAVPAPPNATKPAASPPSQASIELQDPPAPPPITSADFQGFQLKPAEAANQQTEQEAPAAERYELTLRLEKGDTIEKMLADIDVPEADRKLIEEKLQALLKKRRIAPGEEIVLDMQTVPGQPDAPRVLALSVRPQPEHEYIVRRQDDGSYSGEEKTYKVSPRIVRVEATRNGSLQQSGMTAGAPAQAMVEFIRALANDVDFQRALKHGQKFSVLLEQLVTSDGKVTHPGRLLAGELFLNKRTVTVIRFRPQGGAEGFYNPRGESVVRSFLRTPMDVSKVTSGFGWREHPILGYSAMHTGVDFGAPQGTPILAAGAGKVVMAGFNGGYGLYVKLEHTKDIGTGYGHMSRLGPGIKPGVSVRQGQVIGFVGSTGMSTGPHLHYEFYRAGHPVNPLAQKFAMQATLAGKDLQRFRALAGHYVAELKNAPPALAPEPKSKDTVPQLARGE